MNQKKVMLYIIIASNIIDLNEDFVFEEDIEGKDNI